MPMKKEHPPLLCKCVTGATVRVQQKPLVAPPPGMWQKGMKIHWSVESPKTSHWMAHLKNKEGALIVGLKQMSKFQQLAKTRVMTISPEKGLPKVRMFQFLLLSFLFSCQLTLAWHTKIKLRPKFFKIAYCFYFKRKVESKCLILCWRYFWQC